MYKQARTEKDKGENNKLKIALVGNQNSGKTTLFNLLTGNINKVGNYPGVSVDIKEGNIIGTNHKLIDLPGIYSLSSYSSDEEITTGYVLNENIDLIINIVDSSELERSLYLTTQLMDLNINMILVLNMNDLLLEKGISIDEKLLSNIFGIDVIKVSSINKEGIDELLKSIEKDKYKIVRNIFNNDIELKIERIKKLLNKDILNKRFISIKLLEKDISYYKYINNEILYLINESNINYEDIISYRYKYIESVKSKVYKRVDNKKSITEKIDKIILNKYLCFPIFIIIMFLIYYLSINIIGNNLSLIINKSLYNISFVIRNILFKLSIKESIINLIINGILSGLFLIISFIPGLFSIFFFISVLETTGYISRVSFMFDKLFRKINLSGKSIISFLVGCGCSVPGILSTRTIKNKDQREMTSILVPFIPCSAKLPIILLMCNYFFKGIEVLIIFSIYLISILVIIISSLIMKKYIYNKNNSEYIEALPDYKKIDLKYIINDSLDKIISFIKRAGLIIFISSIIIYLLTSYTFNLEYTKNITDSILYIIGKKISFIFYPFLGKESWEASVSIILGLFAKEQVVSSLNLFNNIEGNVINNIFTSSSAYSFIIFNLFTIPCISSISALRSEFKNKKNILFVMLYQFSFALALSTLIYKLLNNFNIIFVLIILVIIFIYSKIKIPNKCHRCGRCKRQC